MCLLKCVYGGKFAIHLHNYLSMIRKNFNLYVKSFYCVEMQLFFIGLLPFFIKDLFIILSFYGVRFLNIIVACVVIMLLEQRTCHETNISHSHCQGTPKLCHLISSRCGFPVQHHRYQCSQLCKSLPALAYI